MAGFGAILGSIAGGVGNQMAVAKEREARDAAQMRAEKLQWLIYQQTSATQQSQFGQTMAAQKDQFGQQLQVTKDAAATQKDQFGQTFGLQKDTLAENKRQFDETKGLGKVTDDMANVEYLVKNGVDRKKAERTIFENKGADPMTVWTSRFNAILDSVKDPLANMTPEKAQENYNFAVEKTNESMARDGYSPDDFAGAAEAAVPAPDAATPAPPAAETPTAEVPSSAVQDFQIPAGTPPEQIIRNAIEALKDPSASRAVIRKIREELIRHRIDPTLVGLPANG